MARRPERRPSRAATKPTRTQTATAIAMKMIAWVMLEIDFPRPTERHAPNMTGLERAGRTAAERMSAAGRAVFARSSLAGPAP